MLENRKALTLCIGYILGIIMGLYCKISIVLFYICFYFWYLVLKMKKSDTKFKLNSLKRYFRYIKVIFNKKCIKIIIIFSIISNSIVLFQNYKYENLYKDLNEQRCKFQGIVVSSKNDKYKIKILNKKYKNTYLYIYVNNENIEYGDEIIFSGKFRLPQRCSNFKGFDSSQYYKMYKVYGTVKVEHLEIISRHKKNRYINDLAKKVKEIIENTQLSKDEKAILCGILLGDKTEISEEMLSSFSISNISYVLAVSGMHISYIIVISSFIFNKLVGKHYSKLITSIIVFIYMYLVNFTPSVVRAGICGIIAIMSNFFYRRNDKIEAISLSLFIILLYNPFLILDVGLQMSFSATICILLFTNTFFNWIKDILDRKYRIALRRNKRLQKFLIKKLDSKIGNIILKAFIVTISATLAVNPVVLVNFHRVSITSLLISVLISFIIGPIVILGIIFVFVRVKIVEVLLQFFIKVLIKLAILGTKLPLNQIYLVIPSMCQIIIYYVFIISFYFILCIKLEKNPSMIQIRIKNLISLFKYKCKQMRKKIISAFLIISLLFMIIFYIPKDLKIHFVDVSQGDCTLIVTPKNKSILVDGGGSEWSDIR